MRALLFAFAKEHHLSGETTIALEQFMAKMITASLEAGHSLLTPQAVGIPNKKESNKAKTSELRAPKRAEHLLPPLYVGLDLEEPTENPTSPFELPLLNEEDEDFDGDDKTHILEEKFQDTAAPKQLFGKEKRTKASANEIPLRTDDVTDMAIQAISEHALDAMKSDKGEQSDELTELGIQAVSEHHPDEMDIKKAKKNEKKNPWAIQPDEAEKIVEKPVEDEASAATLSMKSNTDLPSQRREYSDRNSDSGLAMPPLRPEERYELLNISGTGGMGRVQRVRDWRLNRVLAMKILHPSWLRHPEWVQKFIEEAQATSQLQHPGIVPVHDLGQFEDGRFFFTMKHVIGQTLGEVIDECHAAVSEAKWQTTKSGWSFRRLIDAFHRICEAVAYAHSLGVLHRDLKPDNVMVGKHGEVKVVDWGLVKFAPQHAQTSGLPAPTEGGEEREYSSSPPSDDSAFLPQERKSTTQFGEVKGTPAYMSPEQAAGEVDQIAPPTDVYGLGAILYQILSGSSPYTGGDVRKVLFCLLSEAPPPPGRIESGRNFSGTLWEDVTELSPTLMERPALPFDLVYICGKALSHSPEDRYAHAGKLAHEIEMWLEGAQKKARALELVEEAKMITPSATALRDQAKRLRHEAAEELAQIKPWIADTKKRKGWEKQDQATTLEWEAWLKEVAAEQKLQAALSHVPNLEEAHAALVSRYGRLHREAEEERRAYSQMRAERYLQIHTSALPSNHPTQQRAVQYLSGEGFLSLETDPPGCSVLLYRYVKEHRRMKPVFVRFLGETPLKEIRLGLGSYLLLLRKEGHEEARYPVLIERMEKWDGRLLEGDESIPVQLQVNGSTAKNECYVPGGWYWAGGDAEAISALSRQRLWVDSFVIQKFSVTNTQYTSFLDDLIKQGREKEAMRYVPRERPGSTEEQGAAIYGRTPEGRFVLRPDTEGDIWYPNYPVLMVDWFGAQAYAQWFAKKTRRPWRLPSELEWEKAARGVDGRLFPWGDFLDPSWCCMRESRPGRPLPSVMGSYEEDQSPYGVREMAGNVRDWCLEIFQPHGPATIDHRVQIPLVSQRPDDTIMESAPRILRVRRGGGWDLSAKFCRVAGRDGDYPGFRDYMSGFRLVRSLW